MEEFGAVRKLRKWRPEIGGDIQQLGDAELLQRAQEGRNEAFHVLVDRHADALFGLAVRMVGNEADAEDVLQKTFMGAVRHLQVFEGRSSVKTWLTGILMRQAAKHHRSSYRRRKRESAHLSCRDESSLPERDSDWGMSDAQIRMDVQTALDSLSEEHRQVIVLREMEGMTYREMADCLDVPRGTVESRLYRARRKMQEVLGDYIE